jgi:hypothetical protein
MRFAPKDKNKKQKDKDTHPLPFPYRKGMGMIGGWYFVFCRVATFAPLRSRGGGVLFERLTPSRFLVHIARHF